MLVTVDERGFISVDKQQRTNVNHIFAIGDVVGQPMLAHKATHEAKTAAEVIAGKKHFFEPKVIPSIMYTNPEVAWAGVTEKEAKDQGIEYDAVTFPWSASGRAIASNAQQGMTKLIFDLRNNGGGFMHAATDIVDEFLPSGKLIVYTEGRKSEKQEYYSTAKGILAKKEVIVLINSMSASASEIVAGAIQDNDRGLIMGRRSFGKGLVQDQSEFTDGSALRLTISRYYTPSGRCIQALDYWHRNDKGEAVRGASGVGILIERGIKP